MTVPDRIPSRFRDHHAQKDLRQRKRVQVGHVGRMLGTDCESVHQVRVGRRTIHFARHALQTWLKRVDYQPSTEWHGVNELAKMLERGPLGLVRQAPAEILPLSLYSHAINDGYLTCEHGCFPVTKNPDGRLVATTYLSYRKDGS